MSTKRALMLHKVRGYFLQREINEEPKPEEWALRDYSIVCPLNAPGGGPRALPGSWVPFPSIGPEALYVAPSADERALPSLFIQPLLCLKRGRPQHGIGYVGVDSRILMDERLPEEMRPSRPPGLRSSADSLAQPKVARPRFALEAVLQAIGLPTWVPPPSEVAEARPIRVAVIDMSFGGWGALGTTVDEAPLGRERARDGLDFPRTRQPPERFRQEAGHGVRMARVIQALLPGARLGLFETPLAQDSYLYATDLAAALARAVGEWQADVVLVAQADGLWGLPAHLRLVLRNAARHGRGGRGAVVVCSVGRLDTNRDVHDSAALAGDDFNAQPWVIPVAACSMQGHWYRVQGYPLNRLGPSVELSAPGELVELPGLGIADDASLAAALVAGVAARALELNPALTLHELRGVLRLTADAGPVEISASHNSTEADGLDEWDRGGHNLKLGHGRVNAPAAWLAALDPVCHALMEARHPRPAGPGPSLELRVAQTWERRLQALASRSPQAREYLALRGRLVPLLTYHPELREALLWLARHLLTLSRVKAPGWPRDDMDHGVLVDRSLYLLDVLGQALQEESAGEPLRPWVQQLRRLLEDLPPAHLAEFLAESLGFTRPAE